MLEVIEKILILQERDRKIMRTRTALERIVPERTLLKSKSKAAEEKLESAKYRHNKIESECKELELQVGSNKEKIAKYSVQQFETKKNEEYRALANEMEGCRRQNSKLDDRQLVLMEEEEKIGQEIQEAQQGLDKMKKAVDDQVRQLSERETTLTSDLKELIDGRVPLTECISPPVQKKYERLLKTKGDSSVVGIHRGVCGGCHMQLPTQIIVTCRAQDDLVICLNCGRILYYTRDMDIRLRD
ncbi:MAG TPA: hypothetical protein EYQ50_14970 [Verrucomicrobiales bacterium]|nr:hypothetical protein [Verrucomicrobiales bacterium]HIL68864.1 hypothetical protein [Verrucomicrobiota bacterium]